jgi:hypothetical protein
MIAFSKDGIPQGSPRKERPPMRRPIALIACLLLVCSAYAGEVIPDIVTVSLADDSENAAGQVIFEVRFRNDGAETIEDPSAVVTLKKDGLVVGMFTDFLQTPTRDVMMPGDTGIIRVGTTFLRSQYDEISVQVHGTRDIEVRRARALAASEDHDMSSIIGDVEIISENLKEVSDRAYIYGELQNSTNAVIWHISLTYNFYNGDGDFVGTEAFIGFLPEVVMPDQVVPFLVFSDTPFGEATRYERSTSFEIVSIATPSVVIQRGWGSIKQSMTK